MTLSRTRYGQVNTCRMYFDIIQYAKAIGYIRPYEFHNIAPTIDLNANPFDYNFSKTERYVETAGAGDEDKAFEVIFKNETILVGENNDNKNFSHLLNSANYCGLFGHNIGSQGGNLNIRYNQTSGAAESSLTMHELVGDGWSMGDGYTLVSTSSINHPENVSRIKFSLSNSIQEFDLGTISFGRYVDFPHSTNLSMNIKYLYDGIKARNSVSGRTIQNINYYKAPDWGRYPKWQHIPSGESGDFDTRTVNQNGRRQWDLTWSFLSQEFTFPKNSENNMFAEDIVNESNPNTLALGTMDDSLVGTMNQLSMGFNLPFIFQPDKTQQDFAIVKADQKSVSIQQTAPNLYTIKLKLTEVW